MNKAAFLIICAGIYALTVFPATGAGLSTGADFLNVTTGARPDGMGQAFSAVADDINTLNVNPAGLGNIRLPQAAFSDYQFVSGISFDFAGAALPLGTMGTLGLGYLGMGTQPFNSTTNPSAVPGTDSESALMLGWGGAWGVVQAGTAVKYISRNVGTVSGTSWAADLGLRFRPLTRLSLASSLLNLGPSITLAQGEPLPTDLKLGAAWRMLEAAQHTVDLAVETNLALASSQLPRFGAGMEYWFQDLFALRVGYLANTDYEGFTAGAGIQFGGFELDYAYQPFAELGSTSRFSGLYRWDGPWIPGGEMEAPRLLTIRTDSKGAVVNWTRPKGPVDHYELTVVSLENGKSRVIGDILEPSVVLKHLKPGAIYGATAIAVGKGGGRSMPSNTAYLKPIAESQPSPETVAKTTETPVVAPPEKVFGAVRGVVDQVGLQLSFDPLPGFPVKGYHLYRKSATGRLERVTIQPRQVNRLWVSDPLVSEESEWTVTAVNAQDGMEKTVGSFAWNPTPKDIELLKAPPRVYLKVTPQPGGKVMLEWEHAQASSSTLLIAREPDHVFEVAGKLNMAHPQNLVKGFDDGNEYFFIVVNEAGDGTCLGRSAEVPVKVFQ